MFNTRIITCALRILTAVVGLLSVSGTIASAATLYTPRLHGDHFICTAINVSNKTLGITISILDDNGQLVQPSSGDKNPTLQVNIVPGAEAEINFFISTANDGYCKVDVSGTGDVKALRVEMDVHWTRTIPNTNPPVPHLQDLVVEGH
jgi:hypothetical protein